MVMQSKEAPRISHQQRLRRHHQSPIEWSFTSCPSSCHLCNKSFSTAPLYSFLPHSLLCFHSIISFHFKCTYKQAEDSFGFPHIKSSESIHFHIRFCLFLAINKHQHLPPVTTSSSSSSSWTDRKVGRHTDSGVDSRILGYIGLRLTCWPSKGSSHGTALLGSCPRPATI